MLKTIKKKITFGWWASLPPSGVVVPREVGILLIYAPNFFFKRPGKG